MKEIIKVTMFGKFQLQIGDNVLDGTSMRSNQLEKLLVYLIIYRNKKVTLQELMDVLWEDGVDNPAGALKNLVYRLRNALKKLSGERFIKTSQGSYMWDCELPMVVDADVFEEKCKAARESCGDVNEKIALYEEALSIYKDKFLTDFSLETWLLALYTYYHSLYLTMTKELAPLYEEVKAYAKMEQLVKTALDRDSLDEELHYWNIKSLTRQNEVQLALFYYEEASKVLYKNLGIRNSELLRQIYEELMSMEKSQEANVDQVCEGMKEVKPARGAYLCEYSVFKELYRVEARRISRLGIAEYVLLLTLQPLRSSSDGADKFSGKTEKMMSELKDVLKASLRIGDVAARCSSVQYIVLLQTCSYETATMVAERIVRNFAKKISGYGIKLHSDIKEVEAVSFSLGKGGKE